MLEMLHGGRPRNEEPHVKKRMGKHGEKVDLILRVDLEELGISDDEFDDIQSLFQLYDHDKDGILNFKETRKVLRCLGLRVDELQAKALIKKVSADRYGFSVSFNEYLTLISLQRKEEPDEECLLDIFRSFDPQNTGRISERRFVQIMKSKENVPEEDVNEMIEEYRNLFVTKSAASPAEEEPTIIYKDFIAMLQK